MELDATSSFYNGKTGKDGYTTFNGRRLTNCRRFLGPGQQTGDKVHLAPNRNPVALEWSGKRLLEGIQKKLKLHEKSKKRSFE